MWFNDWKQNAVATVRLAIWLWFATELLAFSSPFIGFLIQLAVTRRF
jgi:hypothetical protein